jgi:hypothetical protein
MGGLETVDERGVNCHQWVHDRDPAPVLGIEDRRRAAGKRSPFKVLTDSAHGRTSNPVWLRMLTL